MARAKPKRAGLSGVAANCIMHKAIEQHVKREAARENFKQEALASWTAYKETGRHHTGSQVHAWLNTWGTESEIDLPKCHE
jgi:predicted transcriptional regulator